MPKPKPIGKHLIDGTYNATRHAHSVEASKAPGVPKPPFVLRGRIKELWVLYAKNAPWLSAADSHSLLLFCQLAADLEKTSTKQTAYMVTQYRTLMHELGLSPVGRARMVVRDAAPKTPRNERAKKKVIDDEPAKQEADRISRYFQ